MSAAPLCVPEYLRIHPNLDNPGVRNKHSKYDQAGHVRKCPVMHLGVFAQHPVNLYGVIYEERPPQNRDYDSHPGAFSCRNYLRRESRLRKRSMVTVLISSAGEQHRGSAEMQKRQTSDVLLETPIRNSTFKAFFDSIRDSPDHRVNVTKSVPLTSFTVPGIWKFPCPVASYLPKAPWKPFTLCKCSFISWLVAASIKSFATS